MSKPQIYPEKFTNETAFGHKIVDKYVGKTGRHYVVAYSPKTNQYAVGRGYDYNDGTWSAGDYGFNSKKEAVKHIREILKGGSK